MKISSNVYKLYSTPTLSRANKTSNQVFNTQCFLPYISYSLILVPQH